MKTLIFLFISIIGINLIIFCYSNPNNKVIKKPLYIKQYEELNRKEEIAKITKAKKKEVLKMKESIIKFEKEEIVYGSRVYRKRVK